MDIDEYILRLDTLGSSIKGEVWNSLEQSLQQGDQGIAALIEFRSGLLTDSDVSEYGGFLSTGIFLHLPKTKRLGAVALSIETERARAKLSLLNRFRPYRPTDQIFQGGGIEYDDVLNGDLIPLQCLDSLDPMGVARKGGSFFIIDGELNQSCTSLLLGSSANERFVRIAPDEIYTKPPPVTLLEATIRPTNPQWFSRMQIPRNKVQGSTYVHEEMELTKETADAYWERNVKGIVKLDFSIKESSGRIFMSVEELSDRELRSGILIGRHIHLDLEARKGEGFLSQSLGHIDLAVNLYQGEAATDRKTAELADGDKVPASSRSHLLRLNNVPATYLFAFAVSFFQGNHLTSEWIKDVASSGKIA